MSDGPGEARYCPEPIDTSAVQLRGELRPLVEILAENAHDAWAATRLADGWSYGPHVDYLAKQHPSLVPYAQLSEADKDIDRNVVVAILSTALALGYEVRRPRNRRPVPAEKLPPTRADDT
ncbi:MAG TPA: RyR domain-containing protein [Streptosporangiaceae bacterium]|nr:RyR domain-containing protein [Streptosporangiaceae bacterium]